MRGLPALALLVPLFCGCLGGDDGPSRPPASTAGVFVVDGDQLVPAGDASGITVAQGQDVTVYTIDWIGRVDSDTMGLLLVQALADGVRLDAENDMAVRHRPEAAPSEGDAAADFCLLDLAEHHPPGDDVLRRALGETQRIPDRSFAQRNASWLVYTAGDSPLPVVEYGFGGGIGSFAGDFAQGEWGLLAAGRSGIPDASWRQPGNAWTATIEASGPVRIILLPPAALFCGAGFARFGGTSAGPAHTGGDIEVTDRYGLTATFRDRGVPVTQNAATLSFGDEQVPLRAASNVWRSTYFPLRGAIGVEQWLGAPRWMVAGYPVPHPPEPGLDGGNVTRAAAWR